MSGANTAHIVHEALYFVKFFSVILYEVHDHGHGLLKENNTLTDCVKANNIK